MVIAAKGFGSRHAFTSSNSTAPAAKPWTKLPASPTKGGDG